MPDEEHDGEDHAACADATRDGDSINPRFSVVLVVHWRLTNYQITKLPDYPISLPGTGIEPTRHFLTLAL